MASIRTQNLRRKTVVCAKNELRKWESILKQSGYKAIQIQLEHVDLRTNKLTGKSRIVGEKEIKCV